MIKQSNRVTYNFSCLVGLLLLLPFFGSPTFAAHNHPSLHDHESEAPAVVKFVENKNQWDAHIQYAADIPSGRVFFERNRLTYKFADLSNLHDEYFHSPGKRNEKKIPIRGHAFRMEFAGGNANAHLSAEHRYPEYHNYYLGNDPSRWAGEVGLFGELHYAEVYPGIDLVFYGQEASLKYDAIVAPGADPGQIAFRYPGLDDIYLEGGELVMVTSLGKHLEMAPLAYQMIDGQRREVACAFVLEAGTVGFALPEGYDADYELVIDPSIVFGSYTGSFADNFGFTATYDTAGNLYGGGIVFGSNYPTTMGAFQTMFQGGNLANPFGNGFDISISKFNPTGTALVWSTYLGGTVDNEQPQSLITSEAGELYVYGRTFSSDYPVTAGAFQTTLAGGSDIVVTRFNVSGSLARSTYVGGTGNDGLNIQNNFFQNSLYFNYGDDARGEVMLDDQVSVYIASCTQSQNFPVTAGAIQTTYGGGLQDGCVFKMDSTLATLTYSTFLGGNSDDATYSVKVDANRNAFVAGGTSSPDFPTTPGVLQPAYGGAIDGYIAQINPAGTVLTASTFLGTSDYDQCFFLELDQFRNVYVVGQTLGSWPVSPGVYSNANGKQFIGRYDPGLTTTQLSTVFGKGNATIDISPTAFLVDRCGFIYVAGWGGSQALGGGTNYTGTTNGLVTTPGAFQTTTDGADVYLIVLEPDAAGLEYATFYGGATSQEHVDGGTSRFDRDLIVYHAVCAGCQGSSDFPTTPGAVSQVNNSTNCNLGVFKFAFDPQDVFAAYIAQTIDSCAPFPVNFTNNSSGGQQYIWNFGDGSPPVTTFNASHIFQNPGTYTVSLVAIDSNSCNFSDTAVQTVTVFANPLAVAGGSDTICAGGSITLTSGGGQFYNWSPGTLLNDSTIASPIANPPVNTTFSVIVSDTNGCVDTATVDVFVTFFQAEAGPPASFCEGTGGAQLQAGAVTGGTAPYYYIWWCDSTNTFCGLDSTFDDDPIANPTVTTTYYLQVQDSRGCLSEIDSTIVEILQVPIADAGPDQFICQPPGPGAVLNGSFSGAPAVISQYWIPSTGLNDSTLLTPSARPDTTTIYTLIGLSSNGCSSNPTTLDTLSTVTVHVNPRPIADAGPDINLCLGDTTTLQGLGFGAGPDYKYEWTPNVGLSDSSIANPRASPPFTHIYTLVVYSNGCPSIGDSMTLNIRTIPTPSAGNIAEICLGDSAQLDAFGAGDSTATYTYQWSPGLAMNDSTLENPKASPDTSTWYYLVVTSSWGCESPLDSVLVQLKPTPLAEAGPNLEICAGDTTTLLGSYFYTTTDSADPTQIYYSWNPAATISDSTLAQPQAWPPASTWYYLDVFHNTCVTTDSVLVTFFPDIGATVGADTTTICGGDSVQLFASGGLGGVLYEWLPTTGLNDPASANPRAAPSDTTVYQAILLEGGCLDTVDIQINVIPRPDVAYLSSDPSGCPPHTVDFLDDSDGSIQYIWDFGDGAPIWNGRHATHTYDRPGTYNVSLTGVNLGGCATTVNDLTVTIFDTASADFATNPDFPAQLTLPASTVDFRDRSQNAVRWLWDFGDGIRSEANSPQHQYTKPGEYFPQLTIWSPNGCQSRVVHGPFTLVSPELFIPNVFTPNDDGINDGFLVNYSGSQPFFLQIFDRWGVQYFETRDKLTPWSGMTNDQERLPEGVYYYRLRIGDQDYAGEVTLMR
ncbi:MAG: PKD domain-containing protein [Bacteroidota bacterium]